MKFVFCIVFNLIISCCIAQVTMVTNLPESVKPDIKLNVQVKINKGALSGFSKYELDLPQGFTAETGYDKNSYFTFEKQRVKLVWVKLPVEEEFVVAFKLKTIKSIGTYSLEHKFSFVDAGVKKEIIGNQIELKVAADGVNKTLSYLGEKEHKPSVEKTVVSTPEKNNSSNSFNAPVSAAKTSTSYPPPPKQNTSISANPGLNNGATTITQNGLIYLIQIGTFGTDPGKSKYANLGKVTIEKVANSYKVLIGDFSTKEEAQKKREELISKGYNGFIVSYQNGQRVK